MGRHQNTEPSRHRTFGDTVTVPYPDGVPSFIDDGDTTLRVDEREMEFTAQAAMMIDTALITARR
jgi:hypothetical protein